jgi:hypothetical protein
MLRYDDIDEEALINVVCDFVDTNRITCAEAVYQNDDVITHAYSFIERLCNIVGYYQDQEDT